MTKPIYFWSNIRASASIVEKYKAIFQSLHQANYREVGLRVKKMQGFRIFSVDVNYSDRLLFSSIQIDGKPNLVFLEEILNHKYSRSTFLGNQKAMRLFIENKSQSMPELPDDLESLFEDHRPEEGQFDFNDDIWPVELYNRELIVLNDIQKEAVCVKSPAIISGPPGSGKSCTALALITRANPDFDRIIYLSANPALVSEMKENWHSLDISAESRPDRVLFLTIDELMFMLDPDIRTKELVNEEHFYEWYLSVYKKSKPNNCQNELLKDPVLVYQELRIACAFKVGEYQALGLKQTLSKKSNSQASIATILLAYQSYLKANKRIDLAFFEASIRRLCDMLVIDEAQDLSRLQLKLFLQLTGRDFNVYFCMDSLQCLTDTLSPRPYLMDLCTKFHLVCNHIELTHSYRVFQKALPLVQTVINMRHEILGGVADRLEFTHFPIHCDDDSALGTVHWIDKPDSAQIAYLRELMNNAGVVIVTLPSFVKEAQELFATQDRVFTPKSIKGLGYPVVITYRMLDNPLFRQCAPLLKDYDPANTQGKTSRPKTDRSQPELISPFNLLFTAITRAEFGLIFIEESKHALAPIINPLKANIEPSPLLIRLQETHSSEEDWLKEAVRQLKNNNQLIAETIFTNRLKKTKKEFKDFAALLLTKPEASTSNPPEVLISAGAQASTSAPQKRLPAEKPLPRQSRKKAIQTRQQPKLKHERAKATVSRLVKAPPQLQQFNNQNIEALFSTPFNNQSSLLIQIIAENNHQFWNTVKLKLQNLSEQSIFNILKMEDVKGLTALMHAEIHKSDLRPDLIQLINKLNPDQITYLLSQESREKYTVLMYGAVEKQDFLPPYLPLINQILQKQRYCILKIQNDFNSNLLITAIVNKSPSAAAILGLINQLSIKEKVKLLQMTSLRGQNSLHYACRENPDIVPSLFFMMKGLTPDTALPKAKQFLMLSHQDRDGMTPVLHAALYNPRLLVHFYSIFNQFTDNQRAHLLTQHDKFGTNLLIILSTNKGPYFNELLTRINVLNSEQKWNLLTPTLNNGVSIFSQAFLQADERIHDLLALFDTLDMEHKMDLCIQTCNHGMNILLYCLRYQPQYAHRLLDTISEFPVQKTREIILKAYSDDGQKNALMESFSLDMSICTRICHLLSTLGSKAITTILLQETEEKLTTLMLAIIMQPESLKLLLPVVANLSKPQIIAVLNLYGLMPFNNSNQDIAPSTKPNLLFFAIKYRNPYIIDLLNIVKTLPYALQQKILDERNQSNKSLFDLASELMLDKVANELHEMSTKNNELPVEIRTNTQQSVIQTSGFFKQAPKPKTTIKPVRRVESKTSDHVAMSMSSSTKQPELTSRKNYLSIDLNFSKNASNLAIYTKFAKKIHTSNNQTCFTLLFDSVEKSVVMKALDYFKKLTPDYQIRLLMQGNIKVGNAFIAAILRNDSDILKKLTTIINQFKPDDIAKLLSFQSVEGLSTLMFALFKEKPAFDLVWPLLLGLNNRQQFALLSQLTYENNESLLLLAASSNSPCLEQITDLMNLLRPRQKVTLLLQECSVGMTALPTIYKLQPNNLHTILMSLYDIDPNDCYEILGYTTEKQTSALQFSILLNPVYLPIIFNLMELMNAEQRFNLIYRMCNDKNRFTKRQSSLLIDATMSESPHLMRLCNMISRMEPRQIEMLLADTREPHQHNLLTESLLQSDETTGLICALANQLDNEVLLSLFTHKAKNGNNAIGNALMLDNNKIRFIMPLLERLDNNQLQNLLQSRVGDANTPLLQLCINNNPETFIVISSLINRLSPEQRYELFCQRDEDDNNLLICVIENEAKLTELIIDLMTPLQDAQKVELLMLGTNIVSSIIFAAPEVCALVVDSIISTLSPDHIYELLDYTNPDNESLLTIVISRYPDNLRSLMRLIHRLDMDDQRELLNTVCQATGMTPLELVQDKNDPKSEALLEDLKADCAMNNFSLNPR